MLTARSTSKYALLFCIVLLSMLLISCSPKEEIPEPANNTAESMKTISYAIVWQDPIVEQLVRDALKKPDGTIVSSELDHVKNITIFGGSHMYINGMSKNDTNLSEVTTLDLIDENHYIINDTEYTFGKIGTLEDFVHFRNLHSLEVMYNQIDDITPLITIEKLTSVVMTGNKIKSLAALDQFGPLHMIDFGYNQISDITPIASQPTLTFVFLDNNNISDISALANLHEMAQLLLSDNQITDVSVLGDKKSLNLLDLSNNPIQDWTPLDGLTDRVVHGRPEA